jgi:hypothetical protein
MTKTVITFKEGELLSGSEAQFLFYLYDKMKEIENSGYWKINPIQPANRTWIVDQSDEDIAIRDFIKQLLKDRGIASMERDGEVIYRNG